jgi:hypothetical protein
VVNEANILAGLNLGTSREILSNKSSSPLGQLLTELATDVVEQLKDALVARDVNTTSLGLSQSIQPSQVNVEGSEVNVTISMEYYWKFVNYGVNGTERNNGAPAWGAVPSSGVSFKQAILDWIPKRGVSLPSQFNTYDQFAYAIMTNVRKYGQEPRPFFEDVVNPALTQALRGPIENVLGRAIELNIVAPWQ